MDIRFINILGMRYLEVSNTHATIFAVYIHIYAVYEQENPFVNIFVAHIITLFICDNLMSSSYILIAHTEEKKRQ